MNYPLSELLVESLNTIGTTFAEKSGIRLIRDYLSHPHPDEGSSLDLQGYLQMDSYSCGAIAGWMAVKAIWPRRSFQRFYKSVSPDPEYGTETYQLIAALKKARVCVDRVPVTFPNIRRAIDAGSPIIACIDRPGKDYQHWVVVYGYATTPKRVFVAGNRWGRILGPQSFEYTELRSLCVQKLLVCFGTGRSG